MPHALRWLITAYCTCALVWGTTWYAVRVCISGYPSLEAAALRFTLATFLLVPFALRARPRPAVRAQWIWLAVAGILDAAGYALVYLGEERIPGGLAAVLYATQPLVLALLLTITRMERIGPIDVVSALVSLTGVAVISLDRIDVSPQQAIGVVLVLGSMFVSTVYSMILKRHASGVHVVVSTTIFIAVTAATLWIAVLLQGGPEVPWPPPENPTIALVYLAVFGSVVAFLTYIWLLDRITLMTVGTLVFVLPVIALVVDALFERRIRLESRAYVGIAITLSGLILRLTMRRPARPAPPSST